MNWILNKEQIDDVAAIFTELCEEMADEEISFNLHARTNNVENGKVLFTYDVYAIYKDKIIYINMGEYRSLMDSIITNFDKKEIIELLKGDK